MLAPVTALLAAGPAMQAAAFHTRRPVASTAVASAVAVASMAVAVAASMAAVVASVVAATVAVVVDTGKI